MRNYASSMIDQVNNEKRNTPQGLLCLSLFGLYRETGRMGTRSEPWFNLKSVRFT